MLWLSANATWMVGELFYDDTTRPYATVLVVLGLVSWISSLFYRESK